MPEEIHKRLEKEAEKKGLTGTHKRAYIYGTLSKIEKQHEKKEAAKKAAATRAKNKDKKK